MRTLAVANFLALTIVSATAILGTPLLAEPRFSLDLPAIPSTNDISNSMHPSLCPNRKPDPRPKGMVKGPAGENILVDIVTEQDAQAMFRDMAKADIPFGYEKDGCFARAEEMAKLLARRNVTVGKVFIKVPEGSKNLLVSRLRDGSMVKYAYHVAPFVFVRKQDGGLEPFLLDPALFRTAVPLKNWIAVMTSISRPRYGVYFKNRYAISTQDKMQVFSRRDPGVGSMLETVNIRNSLPARIEEFSNFLKKNFRAAIDATKN